MGSKGLFIAAIVCGTVGSLLFVAAVASTAWISGCIGYADLMKNVANMVNPAINAVSEPGPLGTGNAMDELTGMKLCVSLGLFRISISMSAMAAIDITIGMDVSTLPKAVVAGGVGICIAVFCSACAVVVLISAAAGNTDSYELKGKVSNRAGIGMILLIIACVVGIVGMASYTGGSQQEIHNPELIPMENGSAFSNAFHETPFSRRKRDLTDLPSLSSMFNFDLHYSYAFFLGWVAGVFLVISAIISAVGKQKLINQPYREGNNFIL